MLKFSGEMYIWVFTLLNTEMVQRGTSEAKDGNDSQVIQVETHLVQLLMKHFHLFEKKVHAFMTIQQSFCCAYLSPCFPKGIQQE